MDPSVLNGLTPVQLLEKIQQSSIGFSVEGQCIQYLGKEIQLKDGKTIVSDLVVSEQEAQSAQSKILLGRAYASNTNNRTQ